MRSAIIVLTCILTFATGPLMAATENTTKPPKIFSTDNVISAKIDAPWQDIRRSEGDEVYKGKFIYTDANGKQVTIPVDISLRGLTRRRICEFPPLRLGFDKEASKRTEFRGAGNLKLVTHCFRSSRYAQYYIKEYLSYRIYNLVTPLSYRVQGLDLSYIDGSSNFKMKDRFGFLIEDPDDVAKRNDLEKLPLNSTEPQRLDAEETSRFMLFQYMIANLDWSALSGHEGKCCHNARLVGESPDADPIFVIPYDLDASGLVNTHYSAPPANLRVRSVQQRLFRGFCPHNQALPGALEEYRALRGEILALFENDPRLSSRERSYATKFLSGFYSRLETDKDVQKELIGNCRG